MGNLVSGAVEERVLRRTEVTRGWIKLHNDELHNLIS
jgi:hypothetical protein